MKNKKDSKVKKAYYKSKLIWLFVGFIFFLFFVMSVFYIKFIRNLTYKNVYNNITELSEQTASQLNLTINNQEKFVEIMIDSINHGYFNTFDEIFERFKGDLDEYHFTRLVILDEAGNGITSDGYSVENYEHIEEFFRQDTIYLSENRPSTVSSNQVNIYSKTFMFNGKKMVLFATINTENYKEILARRLFNGKGGTYLVNNNGIVLIDSYNEINKKNISFYDYMNQEHKVENTEDLQKIKDMLASMKKKKVGTFHLTIDRKVNFIHYEKINVNDWYVVTVAPDSTIAKELNLFVGLSIGLCLVINIIAIVMFIYIYISNQKKNARLYETVYIDPVTSLGNELYFKENGAKFLKIANKHKYIAVIDINKFKAFSRIYDYDFCNLILKTFGNRLSEVLPVNNITCRMSRDLFAVAFSYDDNIKKLIDKILDEVSILKVEDVSLYLNLSIGIYKVTMLDNNINKVLDKAYMAHSRIKGLYKDKYYIFDESLERRVLEEQQIESDMKNALRENEFKVLYQPKVFVKNEKMAGCEALVRWYKDERIISPEKFIPLFEKNKFIIKLDLYVFEQVCKDIVSWKKKYKNIPVVSVNISKEHFDDEYFIDEYVKITDKYGIDRSSIELEITESSAMDEEIDILKIIDYIKHKGFIISIDDFGTGYSSLSMLQNMSIDIIKIDKVFIENADVNSNKNIINYIQSMAKSLSLKTVVEGVETKKQVDFVKKVGCDIIQGYYYSKPITSEEFDEYLNKNDEELSK